MVRAWYMDDDLSTDQREEHQLEPPVLVSLDEVREKSGVLYWKLNANTYEEDGELEKIKKERGYSYTDVIEISKDKLPNYEEKLQYRCRHVPPFTRDSLVRITTTLNCIPKQLRIDAGLSKHTHDGSFAHSPLKNYIKAMRLFVGEPVWTPINRPADDHPARSQYLETLSQTCNCAA
ncbi:hypothetical protein HPB49_018759 [Dermacentor silvarum]|uniref:Uncharacterized protein n=1 Tax=Dermacentor silvarum TaxID=543639 RepID=A0ACB8CZB6_DERSI|nr:hypothetical protein HPB49_018759 [Dermacentor silvarum]